MTLDRLSGPHGFAGRGVSAKLLRLKLSGAWELSHWTWSLKEPYARSTSERLRYMTDAWKRALDHVAVWCSVFTCMAKGERTTKVQRCRSAEETPSWRELKQNDEDRCGMGDRSSLEMVGCRRRAEQAWRIRWGSMVSVVARAVASSLLGLLGLWVRMGTPLCSTMWSVRVLLCDAGAPLFRLIVVN